jgi:DNA ligase (NAD+)
MPNSSFNEKLYLENKVRVFARFYYEGNPIVSDSEFDSWASLLEKKFPDSELLKATGWGYDPKKDNESNLRKINHIYQEVGSIDRKPRSVADIPSDFKLPGTKKISAKLDGISGVAYIRNGAIYLGLTRGDGITGLDITNKIKSIMSRFKSNIDSRFTGAIRGELVISNKNWEIMKEAGIAGEDQRNVAAGIIRRNEIDSDLKFVDFVVYKIIAFEGDQLRLSNAEDVTEFLHNNFQNVAKSHYVENLNSLTQKDYEKFYNEFGSDYPVDGDVITKLAISREPSGSVEYDEIAYKFAGETAVTEVTDVTWNLTRTQRLVPTVHFNTVNLSGANISEATGNNARFIQNNGIGTSALVKIIRSGEVIPQVVSVERCSDNVAIPHECPKCHHELDFDGVDLSCTNPDCQGLESHDLFVWCDYLGSVEDLGYERKKKFFDKNEISSIEDLYNCENFDISDSVTDQKLQKMVNKLTIDPVDPIQALCALNIPRLGWKSAQKLADAGLAKLNELDLFLAKDSIVNAVGPATFNSILENKDKLARLSYLTKRFPSEKSNSSNDSIEAVGSIVIHGGLSMKRSKFEEVAKDAGFSVIGNAKKATYLVTNFPNDTNNKVVAAKACGTKIVSEEEFMTIIGR